MGKFKKMWEVSNHSLYNADEGEPDTGFIRGDKQRTLGTLTGKPERWFERGGYTQVDFPKADYIYGECEEEDFTPGMNGVDTVDIEKWLLEFCEKTDWIKDEYYFIVHWRRYASYTKEVYEDGQEEWCLSLIHI